MSVFIHSDISARQNSPPWIRRGGAGASQHGVVGTRAGRTTPATACGHGIPSSAEEGSISSLLLRRAFMSLCIVEPNVSHICPLSSGFSLHLIPHLDR